MNGPTPLATRGFGATERRDAWWLAPVATALVLGTFVVYGTWAAFHNADYAWGPYLSPFFSPHLEHLLGRRLWPSWLPGWFPRSPAFLVMWAPAGFRLTCYYYRKAYYRSFVGHPVACAVSEGNRGYRGETAFPLILQNLHRYLLYAALLLLVFQWVDVAQAFRFEEGFGVGVGSLVIAGTMALLTGYTFSCHSLRHLAGGKVDCFSRARFGEARRRAYCALSAMNERHMLWAWVSLFAVIFADLYVRLCAMGVWKDARLL
ncbi:MAG TPA: succinate dehydrogenase [Planctomycetota bacterium]|jgi:hypothetical protein|nr:succinate dehydrogenase [Planctomycetota bacterium]